MNLLELMLKEEVEWPVVAGFAVQNGDGRLAYWCGDKPDLTTVSGWGADLPIALCYSAVDVSTLADDWNRCIIGREEYQAAGGWMKWEGGARNFVNTSKVCVKFRGEAPCDTTGIAYEYLWTHSGLDSDIIAYRIINQQPVQLDNPEIEPDLDTFISVDDAQTYKAENAITPSKYTKQIHGVSVDVYDVLMAWGVTNPALQHLIKKALQCGQRGHKDKQQDLQDIIDSSIRAKELEQDA